MKSLKKIRPYFVAVLFCLASFDANATEQGKEKKQVETSRRQCTSAPCGNTPTGEDPAEIAEREGRARLDQISQGNDDKVRWKRIRIYSDSTDSKRLQMVVHQAGAISMALDPSAGNLTFRSSAGSQTFNISAPGQALD